MQPALGKVLPPFSDKTCRMLPQMVLCLRFVCAQLRCRRFAVQLLVCLRFLHRQHVVHCDLKPENILLREHGKSGIKAGGCQPGHLLFKSSSIPYPLQGPPTGY